jgi:mannose-6-phosphate isomerase-like protein (cupin superfamily)
MPAHAQPGGSNYSVKNAETVAAWHFHSVIADEFFVLDGELTVETRTPDDCRVLGVGERYRVNAQHPHQTSNCGAKDCRFLIVQGVGHYDFKKLAQAPNAESVPGAHNSCS